MFLQTSSTIHMPADLYSFPHLQRRVNVQGTYLAGGIRFFHLPHENFNTKNMSFCTTDI